MCMPVCLSVCMSMHVSVGKSAVILPESQLTLPSTFTFLPSTGILNQTLIYISKILFCLYLRAV